MSPQAYYLGIPLTVHKLSRCPGENIGGVPVLTPAGYPSFPGLTYELILYEHSRIWIFEVDPDVIGRLCVLDHDKVFLGRLAANYLSWLMIHVLGHYQNC